MAEKNAAGSGNSSVSDFSSELLRIEQLLTAMYTTAEAIMFDLKEPIGMAEWLALPQ